MDESPPPSYKEPTGSTEEIGIINEAFQSEASNIEPINDQDEDTKSKFDESEFQDAISSEEQSFASLPSDYQIPEQVEKNVKK